MASSVGLGNGVQKIFYLPESHTDMIFAIIGEELGLVGSVAVIVGFILFGYTGFRIALACRDLALERVGVLARVVLEHWGVRSSADIGDVVFTLVELELLMSQATDTRDEFADVFDFDHAFQRDYPWCAQFV